MTGPTLGLGRRTLIALALTLGLLVLYGSLGNLRLNEMDATDRWMSHTQRVITEVNDCLSSLLDAEASQRGYLLTHDQASLERFRAATAKTSESVDRLGELSAGDVRLEAEVRDLRLDVAARLQAFQTTLPAAGSPTIVADFDLSPGIRAMTQARQRLSRIRQEQGQLLEARHARSQAAFQVMRRRLWLLMSVVIALLFATLMFVRREITNQRRMFDAWAQLAAIVDSSTDAIIGQELSGKISNWNGSAERIFGYSATEIVGQSAMTLVPPQRRNELRKLLLALERGEPTQCYEIDGQRKDGQRIRLSMSISPIRNADGRLIGAANIARDITRQIHAEEERDQIFMQSPNLLAVVGFDGRFRRFSPSWETRLGFPREFFEATQLLELVHPDDLAASRAEFARLCSGQETLSFENRCRCVDGSYRSFLWTATPFVDQEQFYATGHEITERKEAEARLMQAQKLEAVGQLAGGVAHDFNNMLTVILGHSACLLQRLDQHDPQRETVEAIERAARRSAALTTQLLAYSRKQILRPELLDVNALVVETHRMLRPLIGEDIELSVRLSARRSIVRADRTQIDQILLNLAINSRDAMPGGGILVVETRNVSVSDSAATAELPAGDYLALAVTDSGCGMDAETKRRIFEPFFTTKGLGKGTGLGLAMVYGIVKQSGGHVAVTSEPGAGTTFDIYLPVAGVDLDAPNGIATGGAVQVGHETLLLVEDEEAVRKLASQVLSAKGYLVLEAADGDEALRISREHPGPIDLLVADVVMPRTSGRQVAEALAVDRRRMRVLYMSGYTDDAIIHHGVSASGLAFLQKPFTPQALSQKVREILDADPISGRITDREALSTISPLDV